MPAGLPRNIWKSTSYKYSLLFNTWYVYTYTCIECSGFFFLFVHLLLPLIVNARGLCLYYYTHSTHNVHTHIKHAERLLNGKQCQTIIICFLFLLCIFLYRLTLFDGQQYFYLLRARLFKSSKWQTFATHKKKNC